FNDIAADVVLRSSDNIDFRVFKCILSIASPVFKDMFTLPKPKDIAPSPPLQSPKSPPVVPVSENSITLEALLLLCYPAHNPSLSPFSHAWAVIDAAAKYDMSTVVQRAKELVAFRYLESSPLSLYALSCRFGWRELARRAAVETLTIKEFGRPSPYVDELEHMTAGALHRLVAFHLACGVAAQGVGVRTQWIPSSTTMDICRCGNTVPTHPWFKTYLAHTGAELLSRPSPSTLLDPESASFKTALKTGAIQLTSCGQGVFNQLSDFRRLYAAQVEKVISEVSV
ncbi:hypothetical protein HYDPIDRAFT_58320, partial [Hydnomerulius pinastri MD-312]